MRQRPSIHITDQFEAIIADICTTLPEFTHINPNRVLLCLTQARLRSTSGVYAKIVPMRFDDGSPYHYKDGRAFALPQIPTSEGDVLYLIYVYVPRFFAQPFERRLLTLIHELFHIAPAFDGTIRRFGTRAHGASRKGFNENLEPLVARYLAETRAPSQLDILRQDWKVLTKEATLSGRALPLPKAVRLHARETIPTK